jgi:hypothetical protein
MKNILLAVIIVATVLWSHHCKAQGSLFASSLGQSPDGSYAIGSDSWTAQVFFAGTNAGGYELNSVQLLMNESSGRPGDFTLSVYGSLAPAQVLVTLTGTSPMTGGIFTYSASGSAVTLAPSRAYFVVATASTAIAAGAYYWSTTSGIEVEGVDRWYPYY